jgi:hypothetical protein
MRVTSRIKLTTDRPGMSTQGGMCSIHHLCVKMLKAHSPVESENQSLVIDLRRAIALSPQVCMYLALARETFSVFYRVIPFSLTFPRGVGRATTCLLYFVLIYTVIVQFILSGLSGVTSHLASQAHAVARNTRSFTLASCTLPLPFKNLLCAGINNEALSSFDPDADHSPPAWHPFLINEDIHGPAVDFAILKAANTSSNLLAFVRASDLPRRHELSDKLKDFLERSWASELSSGAHLSLVKTVIDE